ncbi:hypothetical protein CHELA40_14801 [Chelatococcus asaccharovorans]|nr:hypothetical protein CHELA17_60820 [Chelatococcus asaccharovorans]CAH1680054.1 hypothetical protein CHELA40_14801 [Chelatococcus asaccharovorans]
MIRRVDWLSHTLLLGANPTWVESLDTIQAGEFARLLLSGANPQKTDLSRA